MRILDTSGEVEIDVPILDVKPRRCGDIWSRVGPQQDDVWTVLWLGVGKAVLLSPLVAGSVQPMIDRTTWVFRPTAVEGPLEIQGISVISIREMSALVRWSPPEPIVIADSSRMELNLAVTFKGTDVSFHLLQRA